MAAVERRERNEVEDEEQKVDEDDEVEKESDGKERGKPSVGTPGICSARATAVAMAVVSGGQEVLDDDEQDEGDGGGEQVAGGAGEGDEDVVAAVVFEVAGGDRGGLGPADEEAAVDQRDEREEDGAERVEVLEGIERDAAEHLGGGVAETQAAQAWAHSWTLKARMRTTTSKKMTTTFRFMCFKSTGYRVMRP